jgi:hypothetical protein
MTNKDKLFWEKFGWEEVHSPIAPDYKWWHYIPDKVTPVLSQPYPPEPTLDNLFKYCEEKTLETIKNQNHYNTDYHARLWLFKRWAFFVNSGLPHAIALKKAIEEIVK